MAEVKTQAQKFKEIADAIRAVEDRTESYTIAANDFAKEIGKLDPTLAAHDGDFENGYYGVRAAKCAATYLMARVMGLDKFAYHTGNIFSQVTGHTPLVRFGEYARIDCSAFVGLCLRGIPYDNSPYATHKGVDETWNPSVELPSMYGTEGWEFRELDAQQSGLFNDIGLVGCSTVRSAADLGRYFHKYGRVLFDRAVDGVIIDHSGIGLQPGDLVFWDTSDNKDVDGRYKSISHVAIVAENTDYYYHVTGTQGETDQLVVRYEDFAEVKPITDPVTNEITYKTVSHPNSAMVLAVRPDYRPRLPKAETPRGVNLLEYPWVYSRLGRTEKNGLTVTLLDWNHIEVSGTATESTTLGLTYTRLSPGEYELSGIEDKDFAGVSFTLQVRNADGTDFTTKVRYPVTSNTVNEFTLTEETDITARLYIAKGETLVGVCVVPTLIRK